MDKKILFITSTRIGDAVLSTGLLEHILNKYPSAKITIACGPHAVSLFEGVPNLERIIPLCKRSWGRHWIELWKEVVKTQWDLVVDLRNSAVSRCIRAKNRYIHGAYVNKNQHKLFQIAQVMKLAEPLPPRLFPSTAQLQKAQATIPDGNPVLAICPTANWIGKSWPSENFISLLKEILSKNGRFHGWRVAIFAGPGEEHLAYPVFYSLPEECRIDIIAKHTPGGAATCLMRCSFFIGNDSGLLHCAVAAGIPTLGLFGPSDNLIYGSIDKKSKVIRTPESLAELLILKNSKKNEGSLMAGLSVERVLDALR